MNKDKTSQIVNEHWDSWFVPGLSDFIAVPNLTTMVDPEYLTNGLVEKAIDLVEDYVQKLGIQGISREIFRGEGGLPLVVYVIEGPNMVANKNVLVYGHLDKQPYGVGWADDIPPNKPTIKGDLLYGRGGADDGYAPFSCLLAVKAAQEQGAPMPRVVLVLETEEESGSPNLVNLLKQASGFMKTPDVLFCMDSGAFNYDQLWMTSSLRGICIIDADVECGIDGYHSGEVGGIVPETFRIVRKLLDRLDDSETGTVISELQMDPPQYKIDEAKFMANLAGPSMYEKYAVHPGVKHCSTDDLVHLYQKNTWEANMSITGADGLPPITIAGNVVRPKTSVRISMRLPPTMDPHKAEKILREKLTTDVPYNAKVTLHGGHSGSGWCMKTLAPELLSAIEEAGATFYDGKKTGSYGMGGSIPFLSELEKMYPNVSIVAFGVLGPNANAHGPNEMIHLPYTKKLTCSLAHIMQSTAN